MREELAQYFLEKYKKDKNLFFFNRRFNTKSFL